VGTPETDSDTSRKPTLATGRIGPASALVSALGATAPLAVLTTVVPAAYARGGGPLVPLSFAAVAVVLLVFSVGYAAMADRSPFAGALYAYIARGLGRPAGLGAAWVALLSYTALQVGLYGVIGAAVAPLLGNWFGLHEPWWVAAAGGWLLVAIAGTVRVAVAGAVLGLLVVAEAVVLSGFAAADVLHPAGGHVTRAAILPEHVSAIDRPVLGLLLAFAVLAFVGFETTGAYAEETNRPRRDAGRATYAVIVCFALLTGVSAWALAVGAGPERVGVLADTRGSEMVFDLASDRLAGWAVTLGRIVLVAGLLAAMIAWQATISRYLYSLGREQIFPRVLGRAARRTSAPRAASLTQTVLTGAALGAAVLAGVDAPGVLARRLSALGGLGILVLLLATSVAALLHLNRVPNAKAPGIAARFGAPVISTVALGLLGYLAFRNLPALLGVRPSDNLIGIVPGALGAVALIGLLHAAMLRVTRPAIYGGIGQGGAPAALPAPPLSPVPSPRAPGAHRPERARARSSSRRTPGSGPASGSPEVRGRPGSRGAAGW
jgi:amino acid transporter